jgi:uncharacterized protein (UPF0261 family)
MNYLVAVIGTLDTKAREIAHLRELLEARGLQTVVLDVGVFPQDLLQPDVTRQEIAGAAGHSIQGIIDRGDRSFAVKVMMEGGAGRMLQLHGDTPLAGVISLGGGTGTHITAGMMRALPIGVPKLIVSTVAARDMSAVMGSSDITVMHAVADLIGLNFMTRKILADAAGALAGMVDASHSAPEDGALRIGLTSFGPLNQCAYYAHGKLEALGYEVVPFHAIGPGTSAMEELVDQRRLHGVLDLALHEFVDQLHGGYCANIGPSRLEKAGQNGVPHIVLPGGLDMIAFECTTRNGVPAHLRDRRFLAHDFRSFVRSTAEDMISIARTAADRLNQPSARTTVILPERGWSKADASGAPFFDPEVNGVFIKELKSLLAPHIRVIETDMHINDEPCADLAVAELHGMMERLAM